MVADVLLRWHESPLAGKDRGFSHFLLDSNSCHLQCSWNLTLWIHPPVTYCSLCCWLHYIVWLPEDLIYTVATQLNMTGILLHLFCTTLPRKLMLAVWNLNSTLSVVEMQHICDIILALFFSHDDFAFHLTRTTHSIPGYLFLRWWLCRLFKTIPPPLEEHCHHVDDWSLSSSDVPKRCPRPSDWSPSPGSDGSGPRQNLLSAVCLD